MSIDIERLERYRAWPKAELMLADGTLAILRSSRHVLISGMPGIVQPLAQGGLPESYYDPDRRLSVVMRPGLLSVTSISSVMHKGIDPIFCDTEYPILGGYTGQDAIDLTYVCFPIGLDFDTNIQRWPLEH